MRTPRLQDSVRLEALNAVALQMTQTPLVGGDNLPLYNTGNDSVNYQKPGQLPQTPNVLAQLINPKAQGTGKIS